MGSSRLPGKVLMDVAGQPLLDRVISRLQRARSLHQVVVATSDLEADRVLVEHCERRGYACFAGKHEDVLDRFACTARKFKAEIVVRVTADCPLIDPRIVDHVVAALGQPPRFDAASNVFPRRTFPRGLDVEVLTRATLERLDLEVREPRLREHVTLALYERASQFRLGGLVSSADASGLRWTVDELSDLQLIRAIYAWFGDRPFSWTDCARAYRLRPPWRELNAHVDQKVA
jgi:spore coat polysaccharide biosynthesis protein SpsF